ncbi:MAG TPA: AAA family ATPase [Polyangiaceae bacterium]|nr:AAA family ATPase [Polyangiaceae bacterium]
MVVISRTCTTCNNEFELHFRYQMEEHTEHDAQGVAQTRYTFYCSQRCLEASHRGRTDGAVPCDACATRFEVELASQVLFTGGRRHYACSTECRSRILAGVRSVRLGQLLDPSYPIESNPQAADDDEPSAPVGPSPFALAVGVDAELEPSNDGNDAASATPAPPNVSAAAPAPPSVSAAAPSATPAPPLATVAELRPATKPAEIPMRARGAARPQVLAVFNHKGGTGKTTTAVHVAAGLAARGAKVLLVDADGQGNVAASLGLEAERSLYHVLVMGLPFEQARIAARPNLDVIAANETLAAAELYIAGQRNRDRVMASRLSRARETYDYVIVDCSPSLSLLNQNALVLADAVLCPVACDYLSLIGIRQVVRTVKHVNKILNHPVNFWGVLPTLFDSRARICNEALDTLKKNFKDVCLDPIHFVIKVKEAPSVGKTLFEYAPNSSAAGDYWRVIERLMQVEPARDQAGLAGGLG